MMKRGRSLYMAERRSEKENKKTVQEELLELLTKEIAGSLVSVQDDDRLTGHIEGEHGAYADLQLYQKYTHRMILTICFLPLGETEPWH